MYEPNDWIIKNILLNYAADIKDNDILKKENKINIQEYYQNHDQIVKDYTNAIKLIFEKEALQYGDLFRINRMKKGQFIPYDGIGEYVSFDGEILGPLTWDDADCPKDAVYILWFNR